MKQNLQTPATPLEMLSLFLPAGLLDYFDLVNHCLLYTSSEFDGTRLNSEFVSFLKEGD